MVSLRPPAFPPAPPADDPQQLQRISGVIAATCAGFNLRRASRAVTQHFDHALAPVGLRSTQFTILGAMAIGGEVTINQLSQALVVDRTTLTRNLKLLRDAGLIDVVRQPAGRQIKYQLTAEGSALLSRAIPHWQAAQDGIEQVFGAASWPLMVQELGRLVTGTLALGRQRPTASDSDTPAHGAEPHEDELASHDEPEHVIAS